MSQVSSAGPLKCAQLQIPHERSNAATSGSTRTDAKVASSVSKCFRNLFEENLDKLREYLSTSSHYHFKVKCFSTSDIFTQVSLEGESLSGRKYLSECDLAAFSKQQQTSRLSSEYITYSCSTLAICGDTIHSSSQLPSPQTQSIKQINSFLFSDLDLILSICKKVRNTCIHKRMLEMVKCMNLSTLQNSELEALNKLTGEIVLKPIPLSDARESDHYPTERGDILIRVVDYEANKDTSNCVTKHDKEMFVLNWLQTVENCPMEPE